MKPMHLAAAITILANTSFTLSAQIDELPAGMYAKPLASDMVATIRSTLPEARAVGAAFLSPSYNAVITLSQQASVTVQFIDEGAGYRNSLAWVAMPQGTLDNIDKQAIDTNNNGIVSLSELSALEGVDYGLVFPNTSLNYSGGLLTAGDAVDIDGGREFEQGTQIIFCLLQNAWRWGQVKGYDININSTFSFYTADMLNPETPANEDQSVDSVTYKSRHVAMLFADETRDEIILGFEDLLRSNLAHPSWRPNSDEDFNDAVFVISSTPAQAISQTNIAGANPAYNPRPQDLFFNPDCCNVDTTSILQDELPEKTNVNSTFINPAYEPTLVISQDSYLVLSFVGEGAIYQNALGYFTYPDGTFDNLTYADIDTDQDGVVEPWELRQVEGVELGMVFAHASAAGQGGALQPREAVVVGDREFAAGSRVGFFLVQDGWNDNGTVKDYMFDTHQNTLAFYTLDWLNPEIDYDRQRHVAMLFADDTFDSLLMGFEDLHRTDREQNPFRFTDDEDFNDNVFCVSPLTLGAIADTNVPVAGDCAADIDANQILDVFDVLQFLTWQTEQSTYADWNNSGTTDTADLFLFINAFQTDCRDE